MRPLSIDALLAEHSLHEWGQEAYAPRNQLVTYVRLHAALEIDLVRSLLSGKILNFTIYALSNCGSGRETAYTLPASPYNPRRSH